MKDFKAALRVAQAFHTTAEPEPSVNLPVYMAGLIVTPRPDREAEMAALRKQAATGTDSYMSAYAAGPSAGDTPFNALLKGGKRGEARASFIPPRLKGDHSWVQNPLPAKIFSKRELDCLANGIYFEARGETAKGQAAVAQVILNRVRSPFYPNTACGVVYQNKSWRNRCQFSFACDGIKDRIADRRRWNKAREIGIAVVRGETFLPEVGSATHYHATYVRPRWAKKMNKTKKIGLHIFYRTKGGGWS
jgi:spore germination cell wall hydrolase CwlJ-like protein